LRLAEEQDALWTAAELPPVLPLALAPAEQVAGFAQCLENTVVGMIFVGMDGSETPYRVWGFYVLPLPKLR